VSGEEVERGKPFPDLFLEVAKRLQVDASKCIVIEDSLAGIKAAKAASALAVGIATTYSTKALKDVGADIVVESFPEFQKLL